jgi:hypothetical protein
VQTAEIDPIYKNSPGYESAPKWIIDIGNTHIISYVGEAYFSRNIMLESSRSNKLVDKNGVKYVLSYIHIHDLKYNKILHKEVTRSFNIMVDIDGNLVDYRGIEYTGPSQPYEFLISEKKAKSIAIDHGLKNPKVSLYYGDSGYGSDFNIKEGTYVWVAWSNECVGNDRELFIDVDSGDVIGEKNSSCKFSASKKEKSNSLYKIINLIESFLNI